MRQTKKTKYRVAVIGTGRAGASHARIITADPRTQLVALADVSAMALKKTGALFPRAKRYASARACLAQERPDIVVIATPPSERLSLIQLCARFGVRAVICEKPLALSVAQAAAIDRVVKKSGMVFVLNYQRRFSPLFARVRKALRSGALGKLQQVTCYYDNGLYNNGGHTIDALLYLLGAPLSVAWGRANPRAMHPPKDPCVDAVLFTQKNIPVVLQSVDQRRFSIHDIRIVGSKGEYALIDHGLTLVETSARASVFFTGEKELDRADAKKSRAPFGSALAEALKHLKAGTKPQGAAQGLAVLRILESITHAAKKK